MLSLELVPSAINSTTLPTLPITSSILSITSSSWIIKSRRRSSISLRAFLNKPSSSSSSPKHHHSINQSSLSVFQTSLRFLDWDKLSDSIASFATTSFGQKAVKAQLWNLNRNYTESMQLLQETKAAVEMHNHGSCILDFTSIPMGLVKSALQKARRSLPVDGTEAIALVALLRFAEYLQLNLKAAVKEDVDWFQRFMPVAEMIMELVISQKLVKVIPQLVDEDGSVKDSASSILKQSRDQVRLLEKKLYKLMEGLVMNMNETSSLEVSNVGGRWCIKSGADMQSSLEGLLLSSGSSSGSLVEPLSAVPLNDELQQARESVAKAEADVLLNITHKIQVDLDDIEFLFNKMILLDVINARARYSISYGGTYPNLYLPEEDEALKSKGDRSLNASHPTERKWKVYLPKAYHPLLLQQHRVALHKAIENVNNVTSEIRRRKQQGQNVAQIEETSSSLSSLQMQVDSLKEAPPIPVDIFVAEKTQVVVITGPNTGGKTICLKTLGLAAMMAKSGVYVLASEPVKIPWFDSVFADIGDEQSLSQSLSTFSGHLKQTSDILSHSTSRSLVLLDEVGAGTNPLEGAALGMSLLESFAEACTTLLTLATTHHGELKTLKYSNNAFENACMEFDEVKLKPTYKILWGIPGRSNAISIAERLGVPDTILRNSRELYGAASAEINEVILEMERFKQNIDELTYQAQHYLKVSRDIHENLVGAKRKVAEHGRKERYRKMKEISELSSSSRSILHNKLRQLRASMPPQTSSSSPRYTIPTTTLSSTTVLDNTEIPVQTNSSHTITNPRSELAGGRAKVPKIGDTVHVSSLNKKATVIKVELSKQEILVQAGNMRMKLKLADIT